VDNLVITTGVVQIFFRPSKDAEWIGASVVSITSNNLDGKEEIL